MSQVDGAYLGGIRTVECLRQRCRVDDDSGCWHWRMALNEGGSAKVHFVTPDDGRRVCMHGRRAALYLHRGRDVRPGLVAFAEQRCLSADCVNPAHAVSGSRSAHGAWLRKSGVTKGLASKSAGSKLGWVGRTKLTPEMVADIRASVESTYAMARRLGVAQFTVWSARVGRSHKRAQPYSVFTHRG